MTGGTGNMSDTNGFPVTLAPMTTHDVEEVHAIEKDSFPSPWPRGTFLEMLGSKETRFFTALADGKVVGYAGIKLGRSAHILNLAVHRDYRRRGIGSRTLIRLLGLAARHGARRVTLEVRRSNLAAQEMYRQSGFLPVSVKKGYYPAEDEDAIVMARELSEKREGAS
jgi:ribosomal-protein-alanine N-acetyltransferase